MIRKITLLSLLLTSLFSFDTRTHVYVGQEIINDIQDGKVNIAPFGEFSVDSKIVDAIKNNPSIYRMGTVGPDGFPDIAAGQVTVHSGLEDGWKSDDWLKWVINHAKTEKELAFAYGYLSHASADVFAHTYVNMYSGDHFDMGDAEEEVELRHVYLETFISDHLPDFKDHNGELIGSADEIVAVSEQLPIDYLLQTLLLNDDVMEQYNKSGKAKYLYYLYKLRKKILELDAYLNPINNETDEEARKLLMLREQHLLNYEIADEYCDSSFLDDLFGSDQTPEQQRACSDAAYYEAQIEGIDEQLDVLDDSLFDFTRPTINFSKRWVARIDHAAREYVKAASRVNQDFLRHDGNSFETMQAWLKCYTATFTSLSVVISDEATSCIELDGTSKFIQSKSLATKHTQGIFDLDLGLDELSEQYEKAKEIIDLVENDLGKAFVTLISDEAARMVEARDELITSDKLNSQFSRDLSTKNLLIINDMSERVKLEMRLKNGKLDPENYAVIYNAIIFSKLALLGQDAILELLQKAGVDSDVYSEDSSTQFNILFNAIKTLDGNHQWLETAPPYPKENGAADSDWPHERHYSYPNSETHGLRLFSDEQSRDKVFNTIFKGVLAPGLEQPESIRKSTLLALDYPYVTCNSIPFPNGVEDKRCLHIDDAIVIIDDENSTTIETDDSTVTADEETDIEGIIRSVLTFIFEAGSEWITELVATIFGTTTDITADGSYVTTTPTVKSVKNVSSQVEVKLSPNGELNTKVYSTDGDNVENIDYLPTIPNPKKVLTSQSEDGTLNIQITTAIPADGITF
jgi:hypothetical protein